MIRYFLHISKRIFIVLVLFLMLCYFLNPLINDELSKPKPVGNYWLNEDTSKLLQIKTLNYETHMIEYNELVKKSDSIPKLKFKVKSKETDFLNSNIDFYEIYEYYHD